MKALVLSAPRTLKLRDVPLPVPGKSQVRVRVEGSGLCGSNLTPWLGRPWFRYPFEPGAPGHEGWGRIDALGSAVRGLEVGQRVGFLSTHAFAEYDLAEAAELLVLPTTFDGAPFPGEPLACVMNAFSRSEVRAGQTVAIVGIGFLGSLLVQLASQAGARVIALGRRPSSLEVARRMGAAEVVALDRPEHALERIRKLTGGLGCERVIEAAGEQGALDIASEITAESGRLVIAGYHQDGPRQVNLWLWNWRGIDVVNAHERAPDRCIAGMRSAIAAMQHGLLTPIPLYTHQVPLAEASRAFELLEARPPGFMKALVVP
jgi:threonine dehydrogenase-like Zn-dependent dehydrogenase